MHAWVGVCVFEMLIAVPDEYNIILNTSKISENEATDSLLIMVIIMLRIWSVPVIRGEPSLILNWPQVSVPLISWPVVSYRKGGTTSLQGVR